MLSKSPSLPASIRSALQQPGRRYKAMAAGPVWATVASYNVHKCVGVDGIFDPERTAAVIAEIDADIFALQEADERFGRRAGLLDLASIERECCLVPAFQRRETVSHGWHGNLLLVREGAVRNVHHFDLPGLEPRGALVVDLEIKGVSLRVIAAHLGLLRRSRSKQAERLLDEARAPDHPTLLMGDLNEWRVRRRSSLIPLFPHFGPLHAALPSFPSRMPFLALDRILANPEQMIATIEVHDSRLARLASDHRPIKAGLAPVGFARSEEPE
ncbi:MAG: endonuclease/exonuclease/phosphatase family protein [Pararhizobium sp.]